MPLSAAERQKRYRERLKNDDPEKWNRIQEKNLTRAKKFYKKIGELSDKEKETRRKNWRNLKKKTGNNIQPAFQVTATVQPDNFIEVSEEVVISDTSEFSEPVADLVEDQLQQMPETPHQTGLENPVSQPQPARRRRLHPRHRRTSLNSNSTIFLQQCAKELERNRVQAERKMAAATVMFAEAASKIAEASLMNAETNRMNAETNRKQFEVMKAIMDIMGQPGQPSSARFRAKDQSENEMTVFCPKCNTEVLRTRRQKEARNADKLRKARKRSRQTDSSSEADSSDDNVDENELSSNCHDEEPEIEVGSTAVKVEPIDIEVHKEQAHTDPISLDMKTEPPDDEVDNTNETHALNEPTGTKPKGRKIPRKEVTLRQHEGVCSEKQKLKRKI